MMRVMVLGNCVAHRLQFLLRDHPGFAERFELAVAPMIHAIPPSRRETLAREALACDVILTQPLFRFGPCGTEALRAALRPGQRLVTFSAPHFDAYFSDVMLIDRSPQKAGDAGELRCQPPFDWDSRIVFSCFTAGVPIFDVEALYLHHPLFGEQAMRRTVASALETCARRDQDVDVPASPFIARHYAQTRLFHSWMHPAEPLMAHLLAGLADALGLPPADRTEDLERATFGFNSWPVITRRHRLFGFAEQPWFLLAGTRQRIEDVAMAYYAFYDLHPHIVERAQNTAAAEAAGRTR